MHLLVIDVNDTCTFLQQSPFQRTFIFQLRPSRDCYVRLEQAIGLSLDVEFSPSSGALSIILPSNTFNVLGLEASASKVVIYWSIKCQAYTSEETTLNSPIPEETSLFIWGHPFTSVRPCQTDAHRETSKTQVEAPWWRAPPGSFRLNICTSVDPKGSLYIYIYIWGLFLHSQLNTSSLQRTAISWSRSLRIKPTILKGHIQTTWIVIYRTKEPPKHCATWQFSLVNLFICTQRTLVSYTLDSQLQSRRALACSFQLQK